MEKDSRPYYYYNGEWTSKNPTNLNIIYKDQKQKSNTLIMDNRSLHIQYYILVNSGNLPLQGDIKDVKTFWGYLRTKMDQMYN